MTKSWEKYINKNPLKSELKKIIEDIQNNNLSEYKIKPLSGYKDYYRIRKWDIRIIFIEKKDWNEIFGVDTRWDIYNKLK